MKSYHYLLLAWLPLLAFANTDVVFDPNMLINLPNQPTINIQQFTQREAIVAGNYRFDIYVNDQWRGITNVSYTDNQDNPAQNAQLCFDKNLLNKLSLKPNFYQQIHNQTPKNGCYSPNTVIKNLHNQADVSLMRLNISLPQVYVIDQPTNESDPMTWDKGVDSIFVKYHFNHYKTSHHTADTYLGLNTGINKGRWHLRHQGFLYDTDQKHTHYQALSTHLNTDIPTLKSQLTLGDFYTDSTLFESNAMRGIQLSSDDRMFPAFMQGYAPTIYGIANSNAKVSIFQNHQEIYRTTVPAGAFELTNIKDIGGNGDLTVVITEADGTQSTQILPYHHSIALLRPNRHRYSYAFGRLRHHNTHLYDRHFLQGTWQQGLTNHFTVNTGVQYTHQYRGILMGGTLNTRVGAFSLNAIGTHYALPHQSKQNGYQTQLQYHRFIPISKTNLSASIRQYHNYRTVEQLLQTTNDQSLLVTYPKHDYQFSINQSIGKDWGHLFGFIGRTTDQQGHHHTQWQLGYSHRFGKLSYGILAQNSKLDGHNKSDKQYLFNISMPLGDDNSHFLTGFTNKAHDSSQHQLGLTGKLTALPHFDYGIHTNFLDNTTPNTWSANANYQSPLAKLSANYSDLGNDYQYSLGASGAWVLHQGGLTGTNELSDTFAIVHLPNGQGATLNDHTNTHFDRHGYAILPALSPYRRNTIHLNPQNLAINVQLHNTDHQITPIANTSVLVTLNSTVGKMALITIKLANGNYAPMGATVYDNTMAAVGFVAQDGRIFLQTANDKDTLHLMLDDSTTCQFSYQLPSVTPNTPIIYTNATCQ